MEQSSRAVLVGTREMELLSLSNCLESSFHKLRTISFPTQSFGEQ